MMTAFEPLKIKKRHLSSGFSLTLYGDSFCACGQPKKADLEELKKENWELILNVRNPDEMQSLDFKMEELCGQLGLKYQLIPVFRQSELSREALEKIHNILSSGEYKKIVIHCAAGGRAVLALMACFLLSKQCRLEDLSEMADHFGFQSPRMISRLNEMML